MKILFDNNMSEPLTQAIAILTEEKNLAERVLHLRELFPSRMADISWMDRLGAFGTSWIVVTRDKLTKEGGRERAALKRNGLVAYVLDPQWASQNYWPMASRLVDWWPIILQHARTARAGAYRVPWKTGSVRRLTSF